MSNAKMGQWRLEGMGYALKAIEEQGIDAFKKELAYRKQTGITAMVTTKELEETRRILTDNALKVALIFAVYALHDEFGFGEERMRRFTKRYEQKAEGFTLGYFTFDELREMLKEELGFEVNFL